MNQRTLGTTGYTVSEIGFGGWGVGGDMWQGAGDREGSDALRKAIDEGVTFFDTALAYGTGHSERLMGKVLRSELKDGRAVLGTKIPPRNLRWPGDATTPLTDVFPAKHITASTEQSLKNLGLEALPVQQLHVWNDVWLDHPKWDASYTQILKLKQDGKVLHWGISINDHAPQTALKALTDPVFETAQVIYNIYDRTPEQALFALAQKKPLGIIVRVPFDEGALTGRIRADTVFPPGDWRVDYFAGDRRAEAQRRAEALAKLLGDEAQTLPELALRFCLSEPAVSTVIPGMRRVPHVQENVAAGMKGALSVGMLSRLKAHAWDKNWYPD